ncbi:MAG: heavy metal-responsive transcriptional regulator [Desertifilum sp.]|nr:heavy metal-responsive transcriptional regulator [Desertifilum sp.]MDI9637866.1 heavy metal-responsive transcriptional regulator [Geitlerinema splendidum]
MLTQPLLLIGQVATQSGIGIKTIRYYEELGLIRADDRTDGGFRQFSPQVMMRLAFIKRAQSLGLSLNEIKQCLEVYDRGELPCGEVRHQLEEKVTEIDKKIEQLLTLKQELQQLLNHWEPSEHSTWGDRHSPICPIIQNESTTGA